ncbi:MAG: flagellar basal-body rod protein FlgF [Tepidanaerobacteraceae bacterium]|nr:flagellar basal-body rod protein FlgF [Tepidanaerobacteraceae bacterium]
MIRGLYTSASGMLAEMARTDVIANNLANVNTSGFKKDGAVFRAFPEMNIHRFNDPVTVGIGFKIDPAPFIGVLGTGVAVDEVYVDFAQGELHPTSNPLDIAIKDEVSGWRSFFEVQAPNGELLYTRDGSFTVDGEGYLVTKEGHYVMGESGPVNLSGGSKIVVNTDGEIYLDGRMVDRLRVVAFPQDALFEKMGDNLYRVQGQPSESNAQIIQGALERSNVNAVSEMVNLISAFRSYEANQRIITAYDETLGKAVSEIARI